MLHLHVADELERLVDPLAEVLGQPPADPFTPEWLATPSAGLSRWLRLRLARRLGASDGDLDGVAANLDHRFPGALRSSVLAADLDGEPDPWSLPHLTWEVLGTLDAARGDRRFGPVAAVPDGATAFGQARRVADLLDRYATHRPAMLRAWAEGRGVDGAGAGLDPSAVWQYHLFRSLRRRIGTPSPAERLPGIVARLRDGEQVPGLPARLSFFGLSSVPGGAPFLELVSAVACSHEVHLFLVQPSLPLARSLRTRLQSRGAPLLLRADDHSAEAVAHPLLRSWARPSREATILWAASTAAAPETRIVELDPERRDEPRTLLERVQADLRADRPPAGDHVLEPGDRSIEVHTCHGAMRQVEVLRDAILHRLADDPSLAEDDVLVVCPDITTYAPLVEAVFGRFGADRRPYDGRHTPQLEYHITDRSLVDTDALVTAFASVLELLGGRFSASAVLDFIAQQPVRDRYELDEEAFDQINRWVREACVKWGLDADHRRHWDIPAGYEALSWRFALDRLLLGIATSDDGFSLAMGGVLPHEIEGDEVATAGRLADLLGRLRWLAEHAAGKRTIDEWLALLGDAATDLFRAPRDEPWQAERLAQVLNDVAEQSRAGGEGSSTPLDLDDVRRVFAEPLAGTPRRSHFFRGGITVSSPTPLRGVPFRMVCVLGLDEDAFAGAGTDGDDLAAAAPHLGDADPRADARQALLETILAASDQVLITCTGRSIVTNQPVPPATVLAELREVVRSTVRPEDRDRVDHQLAIAHPRQPFDDHNFQPGRLRSRPWSFDPQLLDAARSRRRKLEPAPFLASPIDQRSEEHLDLADLHRVLGHPVKAFLSDTLDIVLPWESEQVSEELPLSVSALDRWKLADRLLSAQLAGGDRSAWLRRERAAGTLPPAELGQRALDEATGKVDGLLERLSGCGYELGTEPDRVPIDVLLPDGTRLTGLVDDAHADLPGPVRVSASRRRPKQFLAAWLDLMALTAHDPSRDWWSVTIAPHEDSSRRSEPPVIECLGPVGRTVEDRRRNALAALGVAVDCYRRARREPIPLFPKLSRPLAEGRATKEDWIGRWGGDGTDPAHRLVFGDLDLAGVRALPVQPHDPPGRATNRAERFAQYLWGTILDSCTVSHLDDGADGTDDEEAST
ncbi:exodeoxyribonuclease V subunit gamma [Rhabdothermincola sp.]|uniref:exodeoxyribonuclease V subunit gamma n=1 Tax=Rhabdothermincola sp. TaxID=2820405 RepID=UPI002FE1A988